MRPVRIEYGENDHCSQRFALADGWLRAEGRQSEGRVGHAHARLASAEDIVSLATKQLAHDPLLFLHSANVGCVECDDARASVTLEQDEAFSIDQRIAGCTASIQSGKWSGQGLAWAFINRCLAYVDHHDFDRALSDCNEAIRLDPKHPFAFHNRGLAYQGKGDLDHAIGDYSEAIRLDPNYAPAFNNRCGAYDDHSDFDRALSDCNEAIRLDPKLPFAFNDRGTAYLGKGDHDHAIADYNEAIRLNPKYVFAFNNRGNAYEAKGDHDHAIADYNEAIRLDPSITAAFTNRGLAYEAKGDREHARSDFNAALAMPQKYANGQWAHETARQHLSALGD